MNSSNRRASFHINVQKPRNPTITNRHIFWLNNNNVLRIYSSLWSRLTKVRMGIASPSLLDLHLLRGWFPPPLYSKQRWSIALLPPTRLPGVVNKTIDLGPCIIITSSSLGGELAFKNLVLILVFFLDVLTVKLFISFPVSLSWYLFLSLQQQRQRSRSMKARQARFSHEIPAASFQYQGQGLFACKWVIIITIIIGSFQRKFTASHPLLTLSGSGKISESCVSAELTSRLVLNKSWMLRQI